MPIPSTRTRGREISPIGETVYKEYQSELVISGLPFRKPSFEEVSKIQLTRVMSVNRCDKSVVVDLGIENVHALAVIIPAFPRIGRVLDAMTGCRFYTYVEQYPRMVDGTFMLGDPKDLQFLLAKDIRVASYKSDIAEFVKSLRGKYPWHLS